MLTLRNETEATILQVLADGVPRSRAELSREMGVTRSTVGAPTAQLLNLGVLRFASPAELPSNDAAPRFGRPGERLALTPEYCSFVGVEISFGCVRVALMDLCGEVIAFRTVGMSPDDHASESVISLVEDQISDLIRGRDDVVGLAVSVPGVVTDEGLVLRAPTLEWRDVPLTDRLRARFPSIGMLHVSNDASLYAAAFSFRFPDRLGRDAIVVWLDTGIGGGLVANGSVIAGNSGLAGEIGHMVRSGHRNDRSRRLEDIAGSWALLSRNAELGGKARTPGDLLEEHRAGHPAAVQSLGEWRDVIAEALGNIASILDPGVMLFSGPMGAVLKYLEDETFEAYKEMLQYGTPPAQWRIEVSDERTLVQAGAVLLRHDLFSFKEAQHNRTGARHSVGVGL